ncbi:hypothetical protein PFTANZ_06048, partial [Plasmodium falciparum Tanzania (2000708)]
GNGFDCKQTVRVDNNLVQGECHDCLVACSPFVKWIDNQKLEFLKQKEKYDKEIEKYTNGITSSKRKKRSTKSDTYEGYEKKFYNKLKEKREYGTLEGFLGLLNKEEVCTRKMNNDIKEGGTINFKNVKRSSASNDGNNKTFARTKICEPCPWCGTHVLADGKWEDKKPGSCAKEKKMNYNPEKKTDIPVLYPEEQSDILKKYKKLCVNGKKDDQIKKWECYYDENEKSGQNNNCIQGTWDTFTQDKKVMSYNAFFWDWVYHMLHDSLDWRDELKSCIDKDKSQNCKNNKCNSKCECFLKWVQQKGEEWKQIIDHFYKQDDIDPGWHDITLVGVLKKEILLKSIKDTHANAKDIDRIEKMLKEEENQVTADGVGSGVVGGVAAG